ncbi:VOC family protein [Mycobacterium vicinigordonae]|uniref:VOC family protein n=1 Tax=Mycobacterium vicinigordonae TaxID=1719132 RepID=A0A7D6HXX3_9MYCO|nr:VOC family protein [Mycobacterium vicinigordonae]QLL10112.1 VOC family protein [Mycobacterium vicinigordonae]
MTLAGGARVGDCLARRFLHVNLNCASLEATEEIYGKAMDLVARMRTDPTVASDGSVLGLDGETYCETAFLYDSRGARGGCALEIIEYRVPVLARDTDTNPARPGIRAAHLAVSDLHRTAATLRRAGLTVGEPIDGLIGGVTSILAVDHDGVVIELSQIEGGGASNLVQFNGIRICAIDAAATGSFLRAIGFAELMPPIAVPVAGEQLSPHGPTDTVDCVVGRYALAEDRHQFSLVVVEHPNTDSAPVPWGGNRQGIYRCALRVESVHDALAQIPDHVEQVGSPVWIPLPGTKIDGLYVAFLRSPEGVVFELVERPLAYFS